MKFQVIIHNVCNSLSVSSRSRATAVNVIGNFCQFISNPIGYIGPGNYNSLQFFFRKMEVTLSYPVLVRESAPITTPPSNSTAIMDVCGRYWNKKKFSSIQVNNIK